MKITLNVKNLGHVPSFKNNKRAILDRNTGKMRTLTDPKTKKWMNDCIHGFGLQLNLLFQINAAETATEQLVLSSIASLLPLDDSRHWIPELHIYCEDVDKGIEGATITIEEI
tara:strand:- start:195 stop:533 length:339 start_codon:yes stop_codon:yes gene_type:complete